MREMEKGEEEEDDMSKNIVTQKKRVSDDITQSKNVEKEVKIGETAFFFSLQWKL